MLNAFSPAQEVIEPRLFAGRHDQIKELSDALQTVGSCPVIYGDRGLGKTSLAIQCQLIAMGSNELLMELDAEDWKVASEQSYLTFFVTCSDDVRHFIQLQQRILNSFRDFLIQSADSPNQRVLIDSQTKRKISLKFFETEQTSNYNNRVNELRHEDLSLTEQIKQEAHLLTDCYNQRVLVVIDELDRVANTQGLASFLKALSGNQLKFVLVGIAQSLSDLGLDHPSVERNLCPVRVPRMTSSELSEVIDRALTTLSESGHNYSFSQEARHSLINAAAGFPWFVHVIGQSALLEVLSNNGHEVTAEVLRLAIAGLVKNRFAQNFKDAYQLAVRDSLNREVVLRSYASVLLGDIPTYEVHNVCKKLGVTNPALYKSHLCSPKYGAPLMVPSFQMRGLVRFRNEMFKQYVRLTPSLYQNVDKLVQDAMNEL